MKKFTTVVAMVLVLVIALSGCAGNGSNTGKTDTPQGQQTQEQQPQSQQTQEQQENTGPQQQEAGKPAEQEAGKPADTTQAADPTQPLRPTPSHQDTLEDRLPWGLDFGGGFEYRDLDVNGKFRRIAAQYEMKIDDIDNDPCYTYYYVDIHGDDLWAQVVAAGRALLGDSITSYLRKYKAEDKLEYAGFEIFEYDFKASTFKGKDKDYIVFSIPANWEPDTATFGIANDEGKLLADAVIDKSRQVTLKGDDTERYMDSAGNANYFSFNEDEITYLVVSQRVDGVTYLKEFRLDIDGDTITSTETGKTYTTTDTVPDVPGISVYY
jgi:hypothetical protein